MEFNPSKCEAITFMKKTKPVEMKYKLHDTTRTLAAVSSAKYLEVYIKNKLSGNTHVDATANKATQSLNFIRSNFSCCPAPFQVKCNVTKIEAVQRNAARFTCRDFKRTLSIIAMLQKLQQDSLQQCHTRNRVQMLYRIRNGLVAIPASAHLQRAAVLTRGSKTRYRQIQCRTNTYSHTFFPSAVCLWNTLPVDVCQLPPDSFKAQL